MALATMKIGDKPEPGWHVSDYHKAPMHCSICDIATTVQVIVLYQTQGIQQIVIQTLEMAGSPLGVNAFSCGGRTKLQYILLTLG
jgi:hypothetical protein